MAIDRHTELMRLADACEAASGPDEALDQEIGDTLWLDQTDEAPRNVFDCYQTWTASLDAAAKLVPEGSLFTARTVWDKMKPAGLGFVSRYEKGEFGGHERLYWMDEHQAVAATPALALCAAALRALASQEDTNHAPG